MHNILTFKMLSKCEGGGDFSTYTLTEQKYKKNPHSPNVLRLFLHIFSTLKINNLYYFGTPFIWRSITIESYFQVVIKLFQNKYWSI